MDEPFSSGSSLVHRLDPRPKIVLGTAFSFVVALCGRFETLVAAALVALGLLLLARLPLGAVLRRVLLVNGFIGFLWLLLPWTVPGPFLVAVGPLDVSETGVRLAALITLKCNTIMAVFLALFATQSQFTLYHALSHLYVPDKIVQLFFFSGRYVFLLAREYRRLRTAMKIRGFQPGTNVHTYRSYAYLVGMLLVRSVDRSERVYRAMLCRGFSGSYPTLVSFRLRAADSLFVACLAVLLGGLIWMECNPWTL